MDDLISRQAAICALHDEIVRRRINEDSNDDGALDEFDTEVILRRLPSAEPDSKDLIKKIKNGITASDGNSEYFIGLRNGIRWCLSLIDDKEPIYESSAQPDVPDTNVGDMISRQAAIDALIHKWDGMVTSVFDVLKELPSAQPEPIMLRLNHELSKEECERLKNDCAGQPIILFPKESAQPGWIPVSERLPDEEDEKVLITDEYGDIDIAWFEFNEWTDDPKVEWWNGEYKVQPTAWMPLPEPYKE